MHVELFQGHLDALHTDVVISPVFADERPPQDLTGLLDYRLHGFLSKMMMSGAFSGQRDEFVLVPVSQMMSARRLLLYGLGRQSDYKLGVIKPMSEKLSQYIMNLKTVDVAIRVRPSNDEERTGQTAALFLQSLQRQNVSDVLVCYQISGCIDDML